MPEPGSSLTRDPPPSVRGEAAGAGGLAHVLRIAFPLIVASTGHAFRLFADRVMLARYAQESIAAAMPAGLMSFAFMSLFIGTAGYVNAFVAQYDGARRPERIGPAVWQGVYLAAVGGLLMQAVVPLAPALFAAAGHAAEVQTQQVIYFRTLSRWAFPTIALSAANAFWCGRGHTRVVMAIEIFCAVLNVLLNYALIFGRWGAPDLGIRGAALATGLSNAAGLGLAAYGFLRPANRRRFNTWPRRTLDPSLLWRTLRFGLPNGLQFMLDLMAFNLFVVLLGRGGTVALEAAGIAFSLNAVAFLPIIGLGMAVSVLVGQGIGSGDIRFARRSVRSAVVLAVLYNVVMGVLFVAFPEALLGLFGRAGDPAQAEVLPMAARALRYIAAYLAFDALYITFSHAIRGAGDTRYALLAGLSLSWGTLVLPCYIAWRLDASIWTLWSLLVLHVALAALVFYLRYRGGRWQWMRVIDAAERPLGPPVEVDLQASRGL